MRALLLILLSFFAVSAHAQAPLPRLNLDIRETSISGLSSGAFMAVQFGFAHSSLVQGVGVISGGPYYCAQGSVERATQVCTCSAGANSCRSAPGATGVPALVEAARGNAAAGKIDGLAQLARQRVYLYGGSGDGTVPPSVFGDLQSFYRSFVAAERVRAVEQSGAGHGMPTTSFGNACSASAAPYINDCDRDGAGELLAWIYGDLARPREGALAGKLVQFDQRPFVKSSTASMDTSGWLFVPQECARGEKCRLHIALHGCRQGQSFINVDFSQMARGQLRYGTTFVDNAGYNRWADTNRIVVLYPQAVSRYAFWNPASANPRGCWDWWGYSGADYATKSGAQIRAIREMLTVLTGK